MAGIGELGEQIGCEFLAKHGFEIIARNYRKKWGEIDIIAKKEGLLRFIEVKSVSCENPELEFRRPDVYMPEENVHPRKLQRLYRAIETYLAEAGRKEDEWQLDVLAVFLDQKAKEARVRFTENVL